MDLGREVIAAVLRDKDTLRVFLDAGLDLAWMDDKEDLSSGAVFGENCLAAYRFILKYWQKHRVVPSVGYFEATYPKVTLPLPGKSDLTVIEILDLVLRRTKCVQLESRTSLLIDILAEARSGEHDYTAAVECLEETVGKFKRARADTRVIIPWDSPDYDLDARLELKETQGIRMGIPEMDKNFAGWQPGELVTLLGRAKAAKTAHLIRGALAAHQDGKNVLLITVEINADSIADRLNSFNAGIEPAKLTRGHLTEPEKDRVWDAKQERGEDVRLNIIQPLGKYSVADLEDDIDLFQPDAVFLDGFYFLYDAETGESGTNWKGHDHLARDLKALALRRNIVIVVTMQVREKQAQHSKKGDLDDNTMMGGTGLIMFSDMVLTLDMDKDQEPWVNIITCSRSRTRYLPTVRGHWNWAKADFKVYTEAVDDEWDDDED